MFVFLVLCISGCEEIGSEGVSSIGTNCLEMKSLDLGGCHDVGNRGILDLANLIHLIYLDLSRCSKVQKIFYELSQCLISIELSIAICYSEFFLRRT